MLFIETPIFTKLVTDLIPDDEYRKIQQALVLRPEAGKIIPGSGELRKIRWKIGGSGKRGGLRLIYFWYVPEDRIYMLLIYKKSKQKDLNPNQLKILRNLVKELLK
jgi:mRNA-degrading endonuclease RelE of RelBE toxin-antitoxin system